MTYPRVCSLPAPVKPMKSISPFYPVFNDDLKKARGQLVNRCLAISSLGLQALETLVKGTNLERLDDEILLTLVSFTDETQDWANPETAKIATALLEQQFSSDSLSREKFITETVLQRYLRPLFSRSKPASITASGRKAEYTDSSAARGQSIPDDTAQTKPWKYTDLRAIPAVSWAISQADVRRFDVSNSNSALGVSLSSGTNSLKNQLIAKHWPLFIPVLLTLADDSTTPIRRQGLLILTEFLAKFPDRTLRDTGLAQVFEDAIFPTLAFLPSLTPDDESVQLLVPAYTALLSLASKQPAVGKDGIPNEPKNRLLDKMLREGIFMAYFHAKEHIRIVDVLCQQTAAILNQMGIHAVKHLKVNPPSIATPPKTSSQPIPCAVGPDPNALHHHDRPLRPGLPSNTPLRHQSPPGGPRKLLAQNPGIALAGRNHQRPRALLAASRRTQRPV